MLISTNGTRKLNENTKLIVYLGDYLQLFCEVYGADEFHLVLWLMNSTDIQQYAFFDNYTYDGPKCLQTGIKHFRNLTYNDSGMYTCLYGSKENYISVTVELSVVHQSKNIVNLYDHYSKDFFFS